jgi:hypothetical protein
MHTQLSEINVPLDVHTGKLRILVVLLSFLFPLLESKHTNKTLLSSPLFAYYYKLRRVERRA